MKFTGLILVLAVAGLYGCSDKDDTKSGAENASLIEKATHVSGELAAKVKQGASEAGEAASASLDKAGEKAGEAVESVKQAGAEAVESAVDATKSLAGQVREDVTGGVIDSLDPAQVATGKTIYSKNCMACHSAGVAGAPGISDAVAWEPRIAQGMDTLNDHAVNGFTGSHGVMPPRGGFATLNDDEVEAAVAYMVSSASK
jgi:cytochrome c5